MVGHLTVFTVLVISVALPLAAGAAQPASTLTGTNWVLQEYAVQRAAPVPATGEQRPTLAFGADGRVNGTTGCNSFSGPYSEAGDQINIGPIAMTLRACVDEALNRQEQVVQGVLSGPTMAYTLQGSRLQLSAPAGALNYRKADVQNEPPAATVLPGTGGPGFGGPGLLLLLASLALGLGQVLRLRAGNKSRQPAIGSTDEAHIIGGQ